MKSAYLCRVLAGAVSSIDDRHRGVLRSLLSTSDLRMSDNNCIPITRQSADSIREGFPLCNRRRISRNLNDLTTTTLHRSIKGRAGAGRWLIECGAKYLALQDIKAPISLDLEAHLVGDREQVVHIPLRELLDGKDVAAVECWVELDVGQNLRCRTMLLLQGTRLSEDRVGERNDGRLGHSFDFFGG